MSIQKRKNGTLVTVAGLPNIDQILSADSRNAVENRTIYNALRLKVERTVNDLANYYLKSETYSREEVEALIATISTMTMKIVTALPETDISTTTIYLIKSGATSYDEYIYVDGVWAKIGSTEINLEDYYTKAEVDELLDNLVTDVIIDVSVLPTSEIQNIIYRIVNEDNETEYYAGDADNQTTEQLAKRSDVTRTWTGTQAEWDSLTATEKAEYEVICFTDSGDVSTPTQFATISSEGAVSTMGDYICSKNGKNVCVMLKGHTDGIVTNGTKLYSGFFNPLTPSTYPYLDIPFAIRNRTTNVTEMRMGYLDAAGNFYTSIYTEDIESNWDIQLFFSYQTE